ncbi:PREDICTED: NADH dehydrogenase [ubiquinone] 1 alpha subcomplex assembly factor 5 [Dinoponera quadriceps]|uniref:NADH dehydrogenase [ubiquinone] 1 alpha subcomplex assembly factor 5 n=1 Tax=Dinoponera quadriceps TaxID=609295 RepID=A0A6P3XSR0_DINQU|nr:PREDICTED: NADH dehydrogenase [ubiquinone] 1 alpha subcomplex assembly factor 5 [Dinoponera quadriceps]
MIPGLLLRRASSTCLRTVGSESNLLNRGCNSNNACNIAPMSALPPDSPMNVFDRNAKLLHRERAARDTEVKLYDYIKDEVGDRLSDRIFDIKRKFSRALDLGCGRGHVSKRILSESVEELVLTDMSPSFLHQAESTEGIRVTKEVVDEENPSFEANSFDIVISCLSLHWVNNLPGCFRHINNCLKNDGVFLAAVFGGDTLYELRSSLQLAELERHGGVSPHISPFVEIRDIGSLLTRANFTMLTIDTDEIVVGYPSMFELMWDLRGMAENNAAKNRNLHLPRDTLIAAASIYQGLYGKTKEDNTPFVPATYQIIYMLGWKPDPSQPKPIERGTGEVSLKDLYKLDKIIKNTEKIKLGDDDK